MTPRLGLLRHFPTDWNVAGRLQGRVDRPLTAESRAKLAGLAPPAPWRDARVIASPLSRARETAAALWDRFETDERLVELDMGAWEGSRGVDLLTDPSSGYGHVEDAGWSRRAPGGESPADAWARIAPLLAEVAAEGRDTILVCHRGVIRVILSRAWGWGYDSPEPFRIRTGRIKTLGLDHSGAPRAPGPDAPLKSR